MSIIKKIKTDKKFRAKVFLVLIILVVFSAYNGEIEKESKKQKSYDECHSLGSITSTDFNVCSNTPGCYPIMATSGNWVLGTDDIFQCINKAVFGLSPLMLDCTNEAPVGTFIVADSPNVGCADGASVQSGSVCGDSIYKCTPVSPEEQCDGAFESALGGIGTAIPWVQDQSCSSRFAIVGILGGFLALVLLMAAI